MNSLTNNPILLSPGRASEGDIKAVVAAMRSGWLAPAGPELTALEEEVNAYLGIGFSVALSSGTAALHMALKQLGVGPGDLVVIPTVTFAATAFAAVYLGAKPVFVDVDSSWNMDPSMVAVMLEQAHRSGERVAAAVAVDLYGSACDYDRLVPLLAEHQVPLVEDAAEAIGAEHNSRRLGNFGCAGVLSFNGNKLITGAGGGMLVTADEKFAGQVRYWSTQSRDDVAWYEHSDIGYNYRMSNLTAALVRSQLARIDQEVSRRREIRTWYRNRLSAIPRVHVQEDPRWGTSNAWLTVATFSEEAYPDAPTRIRHALANAGIESRPVWKPMHQQPIFSSSQAYLTGTADKLFREGLCLPSGTNLDDHDVRRICEVIWQELRNR